MLIIELTYKKSLDDVNKLLKQHREFLEKYYSEQLFVASGPKHPRDGGIILSMSDKKTVNKIIKEDPFYQHDIADYRIVEFEPTKYSDDFLQFLSKNKIEQNDDPI